MIEKKRSYRELIERYADVAVRIGAHMQPIGEFGSPLGDFVIYSMGFQFGDGRQRICISTGMHGDEPAGPEALLKGLLRLWENRHRINASFTVYPCDNPTGWELDSRENFAGLDLNREFAKSGQASEIAIVEVSLRRKSFHFTYDLHEDVDVCGMYLYERARKGIPSLAGEMVAKLRDGGYPIHEEDWIEGLAASGGIIWPSGRLRKVDLPKAVFLWQQGVRHLVTTESPGKIDLSTRIEMQLVCFDVFIDALAADRFLDNPAPETQLIEKR